MLCVFFSPRNCFCHIRIVCPYDSHSMEFMFATKWKAICAFISIIWKHRKYIYTLEIYTNKNVWFFLCFFNQILRKKIDQIQLTYGSVWLWTGAELVSISISLVMNLCMCFSFVKCKGQCSKDWTCLLQIYSLSIPLKIYKQF